MRELTSHKVNELNERILIRAVDEPGPSGASREYQLVRDPGSPHVLDDLWIRFHVGPVGESGPSGYSIQALLAIVEDRLKGFQSGPYKCRENALALTHLQECVHWLNHRTQERMGRGVEGTSAI